MRMTARYNKELEDVMSTEYDPMEKLFIWFGKIQMLLTAQSILGLVRSSFVSSSCFEAHRALPQFFVGSASAHTHTHTSTPAHIHILTLCRKFPLCHCQKRAKHDDFCAQTIT
jgi:hypothetical protein